MPRGLAKVADAFFNRDHGASLVSYTAQDDEERRLLEEFRESKKRKAEQQQVVAPELEDDVDYAEFDEAELRAAEAQSGYEEEEGEQLGQLVKRPRATPAP